HELHGELGLFNVLNVGIRLFEGHCAPYGDRAGPLAKAASSGKPSTSADGAPTRVGACSITATAADPQPARRRHAVSATTALLQGEAAIEHIHPLLSFAGGECGLGPAWIVFNVVFVDEFHPCMADS